MAKAFTVLIMTMVLSMALSACLSRPYNSLDQEMDAIVARFVKNDKSVRNCVLSIMKGDGTLSWSGASGIAHENGRTPMTKDTPIYIASVTKLFTATAIMRLYEQGRLYLTIPWPATCPKS